MVTTHSCHFKVLNTIPRIVRNRRRLKKISWAIRICKCCWSLHSNGDLWCVLLYGNVNDIEWTIYKITLNSMRAVQMLTISKVNKIKINETQSTWHIQNEQLLRFGFIFGVFFSLRLEMAYRKSSGMDVKRISFSSSSTMQQWQTKIRNTNYRSMFPIVALVLIYPLRPR